MYKNITYGGINFFQKYIPGLIAIIMYSSTIFGVGLQMVIDKESGVFKRLKAAPIKMRRIYAITAIKGLFVSLIGLLEILLLAKFAFNATLTSHWVEFLIGFIISITTLLTLGFLVALLFNTTRSAIAALMITFYPVFFLSDAAMPLKTMPKIFAQAAPIINPLYHVNVFLGLSWTGRIFSGDAYLSVAYLLAVTLISLLVSVKLYKMETR